MQIPKLLFILPLFQMLQMPISAWATPVAIPPGPLKLRLVWIGISGAEAYEFQVAEDPKFKSGLQRLLVKSVNDLLPIQKLPVFSRIRGIKEKKGMGDWVPLSREQWSHPKIPPQIKIKQEDSGDFEVNWQAPQGAPKHTSLVYRVRIFNPSGTPLMDSVIRGEKVRPPRYPKGAYEIQVEPLGDETLGQIHVEGLSTATSVLEIQ